MVQVRKGTASGQSYGSRRFTVVGQLRIALLWVGLHRGDMGNDGEWAMTTGGHPRWWGGKAWAGSNDGQSKRREGDRWVAALGDGGGGSAAVFL